MKNAVRLAIALIAIEASTVSRATTQGEYQTWGIVTAIGGTLTGIGAAGEFYTAVTGPTSDVREHATSVSLILWGVTAGLLYTSFYCFNHASKRYAGPLLNFDEDGIAFAIPGMRVTPSAREVTLSLLGATL